MAWIFSMWIETGPDQSHTEAIRSYFKSKKEIVTDKKTYTLQLFPTNNISTMVTVEGISKSGIATKQDADEMTSIGFEFYKLLKHAPEFRYAITGVEVDGLFELHELQEEPDDILEFKGFVVRKDIYELIGSPGELESFRENYLWIPYEGEVYDEY